MASLIYVHHAGNLGMPHAKKKVLEPSPTARLHSSSSLFHLPQSDQMFYLLSMLITLLYLHSARKHYKNMSFTVHMVTSATHETCAQGCNHVQHIQVASSNLLSELWHLALKFVLLCLQKSENPKKHSNHFNHISYHHFKEEMVLCIESKIHSKGFP